MKTTIDLPEEILHRAKVAAAQRRTTLKELVLLGLQNVLSPGADDPRASEWVEALAKGHNTQPVGRLCREDIYDRAVLRRH